MCRPPKPLNELPEIEVTLNFCILYKGKPNGLAHIHYVDPENEVNSFDGLGIFTEGQLHMGPFTYV